MLSNFKNFVGYDEKTGYTYTTNYAAKSKPNKIAINYSRLAHYMQKSESSFMIDRIAFGLKTIGYHFMTIHDSFLIRECDEPYVRRMLEGCLQSIGLGHVTVKRESLNYTDEFYFEPSKGQLKKIFNEEEVVYEYDDYVLSDMSTMGFKEDGTDVSSKVIVTVQGSIKENRDTLNEQHKREEKINSLNPTYKCTNLENKTTFEDYYKELYKAEDSNFGTFFIEKPDERIKSNMEKAHERGIKLRVERKEQEKLKPVKLKLDPVIGKIMNSIIRSFDMEPVYDMDLTKYEESLVDRFFEKSVPVGKANLTEAVSMGLLKRFISMHLLDNGFEYRDWLGFEKLNSPDLLTSILNKLNVTIESLRVDVIDALYDKKVIAEALAKELKQDENDIIEGGDYWDKKIKEWNQAS